MDTDSMRDMKRSLWVEKQKHKGRQKMLHEMFTIRHVERGDTDNHMNYCEGKV